MPAWADITDEHSATPFPTFEDRGFRQALIDRHPDFENIWLVGGGSGHGFKHGPAVGEHVGGPD